MIKNLKNAVLEHAPNVIYPIISSSYWTLNPKKSTKIIIPKDQCWFIWTPTETYYTLKNRRLIDRGSTVRQNDKLDRYTLDGFVEVENGDIVIDIGAFLGEFSLPAAKIADNVIAIEPDTRTYDCLVKQVGDVENIITENVLIGAENGKVTFKMAEDPTESSFINVDRTPYIEKELPIIRLDKFMNDRCIECIDLLKLDAEGAEPEVIEGIGDSNIRKVAIDAGSERKGKNTISEVTSILEDRGYEITTENQVVFGRKGTV